MRDVVRAALGKLAARFSDDAPTVDEAVLRQRYHAIEAWPADAELGLYVVAWVLGPGFHIRAFKEAMKELEPDFARAAKAVELGTSPSAITLGGIARRAFRNAAIALDKDLDFEVLYWPLDLASCR